MPFTRRFPKRGFTNIFKKHFALVNVGDLNAFADGDVIDVEKLKGAGLVKKVGDGVKILGDGELSKNLTVKARIFSKSAVSKIEAAGGKAEIVNA
jgi:large subunit ribosomal protein L15